MTLPAIGVRNKSTPGAPSIEPPRARTFCSAAGDLRLAARRDSLVGELPFTFLVHRRRFGVGPRGDERSLRFAELGALDLGEHVVGLDRFAVELQDAPHATGDARADGGHLLGVETHGARHADERREATLFGGGERDLGAFRVVGGVADPFAVEVRDVALAGEALGVGRLARVRSVDERRGREADRDENQSCFGRNASHERTSPPDARSSSMYDIQTASSASMRCARTRRASRVAVSRRNTSNLPACHPASASESARAAAGTARSTK